MVIEKPVATIGRDLANDIAISEDRHLSRQHARLTWTGQEWRIENISRSNSVRIDDQEIQRASLTHGVIVSLGQETSFVALLDHGASAIAQEAALVDEPPMATEVAIAPPAEPTHIARVAAVAEMTGIAPTEIGSLNEDVIPTLEISSNTQVGKKVYPLTGDVISIGRAPTNDIVIDDPIVSGQHLQLVRDGNEYTLIHPHPDRSKTVNGLLYQGRKIRGDEQFKKRLSSGDLFRIGDEEGTLVTLRFRSGSDSIHATAPTIAPIKLTAEALTIGRRDDNTIVLAHPQVSARHAKLTQEGATYRIDDLNSTNHVYVNGQITSGQALKTGDEIRIGPYRLIFEGNLLRPYDESSFIRIDAVGLKKQGNNSVTLLDDISLSIPPRSFVALVGGSGAGKSTLLDAVNGLRPAQSGAVYFNGADYYRNKAAYATQIGYVPQDDIVHADLTVERALYFAAKIRLPHDFTEEQIEQRITEVLDEVELTHRRSLMVKSLSGGQRKRVSIALELLANPSVFFLDEPTSGLDPGLDRKMMFLLRKLADRGHTILLVTHATNNINSCDYVCFLSAGGRLAYFGPPEQAKSYFGKTDFAEIYTALEPTDEAPAVSADAQSRYRASPEYTRYVAAPLRTAPEIATEAEKAASPGSKSLLWRLSTGWRQFLVLSRRYIELLRNDKTNLAILLLQSPIIALLLVMMLRIEVGDGIFNPTSLAQCRTQIVTASGPLTLPQAQQSVSTSCQNALNFLTQAPAGIAYAQSQSGVSHALRNFLLPGAGTEAQTALFIMAFATILFGCINGAREFVKEAPIYRRERAVNLGIMPYMFSKFAVLGVLCLFQSFVLLAIIQLAEPLRQGVLTVPFLEAYITLALTSFAGLMTGLAISAIAPNNDRAISFVPIILIPQVIFSGAIIALKDWPTQILATIFPSRWAMAALGTIVGLPEGSGGDQLYGSDYTYHGTLYALYTKAEATLRLTTAWGVLAALIVALIVLIWIFLKRKDARA